MLMSGEYLNGFCDNLADGSCGEKTAKTTTNLENGKISFVHLMMGFFFFETLTAVN